METSWVCTICGYVHQGENAPDRCPLCAATFTAFVRAGEGGLAIDSVAISDPRPAGFRYVIIGNSAAGRSAARMIRALHPEGNITVLSREGVPAYARPLLPDVIAGMRERLFFRSGKPLDVDGVDLRLGITVRGIDADSQEIRLDDGTSIPYDLALIATGSAPVQIPWRGSDAEGIAYFRSFQDASRIAGIIEDVEDTVVVGGGLVGLEFVRAFLARRKSVTLLVRESHVGFPAIDAQGGLLLRRALEDQGVRIITDDQVDHFAVDNGQVRAVVTTSGRTLPCTLAGIAVGIRPSLELVKDSGIVIDQGICIDSLMRTNYSTLFAAGDVAQAYNRQWRERRVITSWRTALQQGEYAGANMAGGRCEYPGSVAVYYQIAAGLPVASMGITNPPEEGFHTELSFNLDAMNYRKLVYRDDELVGAVLIGDLQGAADLERELQGDLIPA